MLYKKICLELLQQQTPVYDQLLKNRTLLPTLEFYANKLRDSHLAWKERLLASRPGSSANQIASEALELAHETADATVHTFDLNQVRYKSGAISEVDLSRTETAKLEAEQMVDAATLALRTAKVQLGFLLGQRCDGNPSAAAADGRAALRSGRRARHRRRVRADVG